MRELFPSRAPFIPRKCCASLLPSYLYLRRVRCTPIVVCDQTTIGLGCEPLLVCPSNKQWFAFKPLLLHPRMTIGLHHVPISVHSCHQPSFPFIPPSGAPLPRSTPSFFSQKSTYLPQANEFFLPLVTLLLMGK